MNVWDILRFLSYVPLLQKLYSRWEKRSRSKSWGQVYRMLGDLFLQIKSDGFQPDVIVGVAREGSIVASFFACNWQFYPFCALERETHKEGERTVVTMLDTVGTEILRGKKVLLIDSECNSGQTMTVAKEFLLKEKAASEVRTMVLGRSMTASFQPNYIAFEYEERPNWPWVYTELYRERRRKHYKPREAQQ